MKERSSSRDSSQRRRRFGRYGGQNPGKKKNRNKNNVDRIVNGNRAGADEGPGVCIRCGHPAPDGKLCNFHRSLLNSIRNDFGYKKPTSGSPSSANYNR